MGLSNKEEKIDHALQELRAGNSKPFLALESTGWLYDGSMRGKSFQNAKLGVFILRSHLDLEGCDLRGTIHYENNILKSYLARCNFDGAKIDKSYLLDCSFEGSSFINAQIYGTLFRGDMEDTIWDNASLTGVYFSNSEMVGASFIGTILEGVAFSLTDLRGANFTGAVFKQVEFTRVTFDETTILPDGSNWTPGSVNISEL